MKHDVLAHGSSTKTTTRSPWVLVCSATVIALSVRLEVAAQSPETSADTAQFSAEAISSREEELRRKEAELLQAINSGTNLPADAQPAVAPSGDTVPADRIKVSVPIQAPTEATTRSTTSTGVTDIEVSSKPSQPPQLNALHEVENHPALESKKSLPAPPPIQRAKVVSQESSSRTRKPDTFRRVDRNSDTSNITPSLFTNPRTVSLQEIEAERDRPAPYQYEAVATIAGRDATLRTGPRNADRALGSAPRFSEVSIDYRSGDWYRVQTGSGLRGWIQGRSLLFDAGISYRSAVRIGAVKRESVDRLSYRR